ncbi:MAG: M3 family oligoendopeptidase [Cytophagales bacterium]|nr:M3 family oligoendopeptidase [Armatimonadota bacterium]
MTPPATSSDSEPALVPTLPRWDMTPFFPSLESLEFEAAYAKVLSRIADLSALFDTLQVSGDTAPVTIDADAVRAFEQAAGAFNATLEEIRTVRAYISSFLTTDSRNERAQAKASEMQRESIPLSLLSTRFTAWLGAMDVAALIAASPVAADHAFYLHEAKVVATHLLPPDQEALIADLSLSGGSAWSKLHGDLTSQLAVPFRRTGSDPEEAIPMSVIRALASDPDRETRRLAYEAEIAAWERASVPLAAALNSIKQETGVLSRRRGWESPLAAACFNNHIDQATLEAMLSAARASFPDFRRYLRAKARAVSGSERLPWYDLFAPMGEGRQAWEWDDTTRFVAEQFGAFSPKMRQFAQRAFQENWVDAEPRAGKRDGAFCMGVRADESRILQNYKPSFSGVSTLAHELGHGYHNLCLLGRTPMQRGTPMTLAETASIFCETIIREAAFASGDREDQLAILEATLQSECQVVVDITSRFLFEQRLLSARTQRELSVAELSELMRQSQRETYGDGLDENVLHPYMWAVKGHYYGSTYYNFPYMFGLLFGLGLYARYKESPEGFQEGYDELLSLTGTADAATLGQRFGIDIRQEAFWQSSLSVIVGDIDRFEALVA